MRRLVLATALLVLLTPGVADAASRCSVAELEGQVMCPTCNTTLDQSTAPIAEQMRVYIRTWSAQGLSCGTIKDRLAAQFGPRVLAAPPKNGFGLLAWVLPIAGLLIGAVAVGGLAWRWSRARGAGGEPEPAPELNGSVRLDARLERRVDEELARFDG